MDYNLLNKIVKQKLSPGFKNRNLVASRQAHPSLVQLKCFPLLHKSFTSTLLQGCITASTLIPFQFFFFKCHKDDGFTKTLFALDLLFSIKLPLSFYYLYVNDL